MLFCPIDPPRGWRCPGVQTQRQNGPATPSWRTCFSADCKQIANSRVSVFGIFSFLSSSPFLSFGGRGGEEERREERERGKIMVFFEGKKKSCFGGDFCFSLGWEEEDFFSLYFPSFFLFSVLFRVVLSGLELRRIPQWRKEGRKKKRKSMESEKRKRNVNIKKKTEKPNENK